MIAPERVREVKRLLQEGQLTQREIAKLTGVSRASVGNIASGRRPDYDAIRRSEADQAEFAGPPECCELCDALVLLCLLCELRKWLAEEGAQPTA
jgi:transcriptional regulator with XRE-family HTH domain